MKELESQLMRLAANVERRRLDPISAKITQVIREIRAASQRLAAKDSNIEVESWPDFLNWWNNNRGQNLIYIFMDTYGHDSEQVRLVKKLVRDAEKHEKDLHEFYRTLRDMAASKLDMDPNQQAPASAAPPAPAPDEGEDDMSEVDALDDIALDLE